MTPLAVIGTLALWLLFGWLAITIVCQYLSERKGYGQRWGLATGLILPPGVLVWLVIPAREESDWKVLGPFGGKSIDLDETPDPAAERTPAGGAGPTGVAG
ncbi:MAG: hypothetical protein M3320_01560 [Actinomycetota bacterium]|nr:hypothetical protein [Actinomycetota bacterium]MDQ5807340.1 hypothetical protein [Actinomycetota bacterium]